MTGIIVSTAGQTSRISLATEDTNKPGQARDASSRRTMNAGCARGRKRMGCNCSRGGRSALGHVRVKRGSICALYPKAVTVEVGFCCVRPFVLASLRGAPPSRPLSPTDAARMRTEPISMLLNPDYRLLTPDSSSNSLSSLPLPSRPALVRSVSSASATHRP